MRKLISGILAFALVFNHFSGIDTGVRALVPPPIVAEVTPDHQSFVLRPGETSEFDLQVTIGSGTLPKLDVLLVIDVTGSMSDEIQQVKESALQMVSNIRDLVDDTAFGLATFSDYPGFYSVGGYAEEYGSAGDYPWQLEADISTNSSMLEDAIQAVNLGDGKDAPEAYNRALWESVFVGWRPGAKRIILLFGDSVPHEPDLFGRDYGVDPGVDAVLGTEDDLRLASVLEYLRDSLIQVIGVYSDSREEVRWFFEQVAEETGGQAYYISDTSQIPATVAQGLEIAATEIGQLDVAPSLEISPWLEISPSKHLDVQPGDALSFHVRIAVPEDAVPGNYAGPLEVRGDGAVLGRCEVTIVVEGLPAALDPSTLLSKKQDLVAELTAPVVTYWFLGGLSHTGALYPSADAPCPYEDTEAKVVEWLSILEARADAKTLSDADIMALHRLLLLEEATAATLQDFNQASYVLSRHVVDTVAVAVLSIFHLRYLEKVAGTDIAGKILKDLLRKVQSKLLAMTTHLALAAVSHIDSAPLRQGATAAIKGLSPRLLEYLHDEDQVLLTAVQEVACLYLTPELDKVFVGSTVDELESGYVSARALSDDGKATLVPSDEVEKDVAVSSAVYASRTAADELAEEHRRAMANKEMAKAATDAADAAALLLAATGVGGAVAAITKVVSILTRLVDIYFSGVMIIQSGKNMSSSVKIIEEISADLFESDWTELALAAPIPAHYASGLGRKSVGDSLIDDLSGLPEEFGLRKSAYASVLEDIRRAVESGDAKAVEGFVDDLLLASDNMNLVADRTSAPVFSAAGQVLGAEGSERDISLYLTLSRSMLHFDLGEASLYSLLLGYLDNPENRDFAEQLAQQIDDTLQSLEEYESSLAATLPWTKGLELPPVLLVTQCEAEPSSFGKRFTVRAEVQSVSGTTQALGAAITLDCGEGCTTISPDRVSLGVLDPGQSQRAEFTIELRQDIAVVTLQPEAVNGEGWPKALLISAAAESPVSPKSSTPVPPRANGPLIALLVLLALAGGGGIVFALLRQGGAPGVGVRVLRGQAERPYARLRQGQLLIGRAAGCDLRLLDSTVSSRHAMIQRTSQGYVLTDLRSTNGTFVNGERVDRCMLHPGDEIKVGAALLRFG